MDFRTFTERGVSVQVIEEAAAAGAMDILQYFCDSESYSDIVATSGVDTGLEPRNISWGGKDTLNAATGGHSNIVRWLYQFGTDYQRDNKGTMKAAMARGDVELVRLLHQAVRVPLCGVELAAANGHLNMLQTLIRVGKIPPGVMVKAAENGHLDIVRWLIELDWSNEDADSDEDTRYNDDIYHGGYTNSYYEKRPPPITSTGGEATLSIHVAACNGHLGVAKYLHSHVDWPRNSEQKKLQSKHKRYTLKQLVRVLGDGHLAGKISNMTMLIAAKKGFLEVVQWLCFEFSCNQMIDLFRPYFRPTWEGKETLLAMDEAAKKGHLEVVKYLHEVAPSLKTEFSRKRKARSAQEEFTNILFGKRGARSGVKCSTRGMNLAASNNHLEVVKWLHNTRTEGCTSDAMDFAAANGHLEVVKWQHSHRSESCTTKAMDGAAFGGHLDVVKWLHQHTDAGCTTNAMDSAARMGHLDVVKWLQTNRSEGCTSNAMDGAADKGHWELVKWLHSKRTEGCTHVAMDCAATKGALKIMKWLHSHRSEGCSLKAMSQAAKNNHVQVMEWLHLNRPNDCTESAINAAAMHRALEATLFLSRVRKEEPIPEVRSHSYVNGSPGFSVFTSEG